MDYKKEWAKEIWNNKYWIFLSLILLFISTILNLAAGFYVTRTPSVAAPDIILDNIPPINLDYMYFYGIVIVMAVLFLYPLFFKIKELHIVIAQFSFLIMVRSFFTSLTHLALPLTALDYQVPTLFSIFNFKNDLFFSGHTAIPFLGFLLFPKDRIKYFFLGSSILLGVVVLLMHLHYTIDVFSAFFITYGTYKIGEWFYFKKEKE